MYQEMSERHERFTLNQSCFVFLSNHKAYLINVSNNGFACLVESEDDFSLQRELEDVVIESPTISISCGAGVLARVRKLASGEFELGIKLNSESHDVLESLKSNLNNYPYVSGELRQSLTNVFPVDKTEKNSKGASEKTLDHFKHCNSSNLLDKCRQFSPWMEEMQNKNLYQRLYRVTAVSGLDSRVTVFDTVKRRERQLVCFDSNSYLGLHRHPVVIEEVKRVTSLVGYGTPSAQMLCGTNRYLRELEERISAFHSRDETIVFPTGFAANTGTISALVRQCDAVVCDQFAHASIQEGIQASTAFYKKQFRNNNMASLDKVLKQSNQKGASAKLVVTDGVFSMHGDVCPLPSVVETCRANGATLMVDDAHGVGVLGQHGKGIEEYFAMENQIDVLMGTLSKAIGGLGGYVTGDKALIDYLRWFASSALFTTSLPAALCAGMTKAFEVLENETEHLRKLWENIHYFSRGLINLGLRTEEAMSPILTIKVGPHPLLWAISKDLFDAGVKCGGVIYPAVGKNDSILRFAVSSRHEQSDLDFTLDVLARVFTKHGLLNSDIEYMKA